MLHVFKFNNGVHFHPLRRKFPSSRFVVNHPFLSVLQHCCTKSSHFFNLPLGVMCLNCCTSLLKNSSLVAFPPTIANGQSAGSPVAFQPETTKRASTESGRTSESGELPYLTFRVMVYGLSLYCRDLLYGTLCYDRQCVCFQLIIGFFQRRDG